MISFTLLLTGRFDDSHAGGGGGGRGMVERLI